MSIELYKKYRKEYEVILVDLKPCDDFVYPIPIDPSSMFAAYDSSKDASQIEFNDKRIRLRNGFAIDHELKIIVVTNDFVQPALLEERTKMESNGH